jgi:hypothetical protein
MMIRASLPMLALAGALAACGGGGGGGGGHDTPPVTTPPAPPTITDPLVYLAQARDPGGAEPLRQSDPITYRRFDYGHYQASDSFLLPDGSAITTWDYPVFGMYSRAEGDGGERYVVEGADVRIDSTRHGDWDTGYFVGRGCGGTGWFVFRTDATAEWKSAVARLAVSFDPGACRATSYALTRYTLRTIEAPRLGPVETIVSEHYDNATIDSAQAMERFFLGRGIGRWGWQAWTRAAPAQPPGDRCPDFGWNEVPGWHLADCRVTVNIEPAPVGLTGAQLWAPGK